MEYTLPRTLVLLLPHELLSLLQSQGIVPQYQYQHDLQNVTGKSRNQTKSGRSCNPSRMETARVSHTENDTT